jgi:hypothetical protein
MCLSGMDLGGEIVQYRDFMPKLKQVSREMRADEAGSAGDKNFHIEAMPLVVAVDR